MHRSASLSLGFTASLAGPLAGRQAMVRFGFSCLPHFGWGQNAANTLASSTSQKFSKKSLYFIRRRLPVRLRRKKFIKGVFARFRPHPAYAIVPYSFRDIAWRGKAESILVTEVVTIPHPPTQSSLCARGSSAFGAFACLRSKPAFPQKNP